MQKTKNKNNKEDAKLDKVPTNSKVLLCNRRNREKICVHKLKESQTKI